MERVDEIQFKASHKNGLKTIYLSQLGQDETDDIGAIRTLTDDLL